LSYIGEDFCPRHAKTYILDLCNRLTSSICLILLLLKTYTKISKSFYQRSAHGINLCLTVSAQTGPFLKIYLVYHFLSRLSVGHIYNTLSFCCLMGCSPLSISTGIPHFLLNSVYSLLGFGVYTLYESPYCALKYWFISFLFRS
jgi:hypothetical protein